MSAQHLTFSMVMCRTIGHAWEEYTPMKKRSTYGTRLSLLCTRCSTERHDVISWVNGDLLDRSYVYPEGYHLTEKLTRQEFRVVLLCRMKARVRKTG